MSKKTFNNYNEAFKNEAAIRMKESERSNLNIENAAAEKDMAVEIREIKPVVGIVTDCVKLNIRKEPDKEADILCEIPALTKLTVLEDGSIDEWLHICTEDGLKGFCMKRYIAVGQ